MENVINKLGNFFEIKSERIVPVNRAFLGLYAIFSVLKKNTGKTKVLFTSNTCASPVNACIYCGMQPIFTDISLTDYLMEKDETLKIIEDNKNELAAVVFIYTFGHTSDLVFTIKELTKKYNIVLIEDAAQAFGSEVNTIKTGLIGDLSIFSFGYSKQIDAGSGGFIINNNSSVVTNSEINNALSNVELFENDSDLSKDYNEKFYQYRKAAIKSADKFIEYSNFHEKYRKLYFKKINPDWLQIKEKLDLFISGKQKIKRNSIGQQYYDGFQKKDLINHIYAPLVKNDYCIYRYSFLVNNPFTSDGLSDFLRSNNINCSNLYIPVSRFFNNSGFHNAVDFSRRIINLWVDSVANSEYIEKTLSLTEIYFKNQSYEKKKI